MIQLSLNKLQKQLLLTLAVVFLAIGFSLMLFLQTSLNQTLILSEEKIWTIEKGTSLQRFCRALEAEQIVEGCTSIKLASRLKPALANIKSGTYMLEPKMTMAQLVQRLNEGKVHQFSFTIVEGENYFQVMDKVKREAYLIDDLSGKTAKDVARLLNLDQAHPEGLLYPDTYYFNAYSKASDLLLRAVARQQKLMTNLWQEADRTAEIKSPYQALILASIIEKESSVQGERDIIASVFYNRLRKGMRLQTDPTIIYGVWQDFNGDITWRHKRQKTPYNTYRINGLPPTPIANPSRASIEAALNPATTDYLYFVASGNGGHTFSKSLSEHNKALKAYLNKLKVNG